MATTKDVISVQQNWKVVSHDLTAFGVEIFSKLFEQNDSYADLFEGIKVNGDFDVSNPKMREHGLRIMSTLGSWIHTLSDLPVISGLLFLQGQEHKARKIGEKEFKAIQPFLFHALESRVGPKEFNLQAWSNVWRWIIDGLAQGWK